MSPLHLFAIFGVVHLVVDLAVAAFLWWYFRQSAEELEEMDRYAEEKVEKRPFAG